MRPIAMLRSALLVFLLTLVVFVGQVEAADGLRGGECVVAEDEVITEDFYFFCNTLVIYGLVDGDLIGLASEVTIASEGRVLGSIWVMGGRLTIEGTVEDDVHFAGADLDIIGLARFPDPRTDIVALGISMEAAREVVIPGDVVYYGYQAVLRGKINGDVDFQGQALLIQEAVAGSVEATIGDPESTAPLSALPLLYSVDFRNPGLRFGPDGYINGDLNYHAPQRVSIDNNVGGQVNYTQTIRQADITEAEQTTTFLQIMGNYILMTVRDVVALSLVGILTLNFFSNMILEPGYRVQTHFISAFSWGLILTLLSIPAAFLLIITSLVIFAVVAIVTLDELALVTAIVMTVVNLGFFGGFFFMLFFLGRAITCFVIGFGMVRWGRPLWTQYFGPPPAAMNELWFSVISGVTVFSLLANLPLGSFIGLIQLLATGLVAFAGLGAMVMYFRDLWYVSFRHRLFSGRSAPLPPPPPEDVDIDMDTPLGMENLPPGFTWFED